MVDETAPQPVVIGQNAGIIDLLTALGRYALVIFATVPILLKLLGARDFAGFVAYFQSADGVTFTAALSGVVALLYGLYKTRKRGAQLVSVAADPAVPNRVAQIK